jgi:hypothetical protein
MELALLTSGNEDVLHDGDGFVTFNSAVAGYCQAGRKGKKKAEFVWWG